MKLVTVERIPRKDFLPSKSRELAYSRSHARQSHASKHLSEAVSRSNKCTANTDARGAEQRNVAFAKQILEIASERTSGGDGEDVCCWKPTRATRESEIFFDEAE